MANLASRYVKRAGITALKQHAPLVALVPATRVYPLQRPAQPVWPFVAWGAPITEPFEASCLDGAQITFAVHCFAETTATQGGEDIADEICSAIVGALAGASLALDEGVALFTVTGVQVIQDDRDANSFHGFVSFRATVVSEGS